MPMKAVAVPIAAAVAVLNPILEAFSVAAFAMMGRAIGPVTPDLVAATLAAFATALTILTSALPSASLEATAEVARGMLFVFKRRLGWFLKNCSA